MTLKDHCQKSYDEIKFKNDKEYIILLHIEIKGNIDIWNKTQALLNRVVGSNVVRTVTETNMFYKERCLMRCTTRNDSTSAIFRLILYFGLTFISTFH